MNKYIYIYNCIIYIEIYAHIFCVCKISRAYRDEKLLAQVNGLAALARVDERAASSEVRVVRVVVAALNSWP